MSIEFYVPDKKITRNVKCIVFGALFYNGERKKLMFLKEVDFVGFVSTMIKFILIHNFPTIIITNQKQSKLICKF